LERVDADTAVRLVGDTERVRLWVDLLRAQGEALIRVGADAQAETVRGRADALEAAATRATGSLGT
ncbi:MAG: hypothetical protein ACREOG_04505, partial [Gemmatimonadaceae bacterium]